MPLDFPFEFDFLNPDYTKVFNWRTKNLNYIRQNPDELPGIKAFYKKNPAQFIIDWGCTADPRNAERNLPVVIPFLLFPKQEECVKWFLELWKSQSPGALAKSREMGVTWVAAGISVAMAIFYENLSIGFGSRKEDYVDKTGDPKSIFYKIRQFISLLPPEFRGEWNEKKHSSHLKIEIPETGSIITGEAGRSIGRGDRTSFFFVDEAAWLEQPDEIEASLSQTTNCRIDISTPHGENNPFARKYLSGKMKTFTMHWRDDPRKNEAWYQKKCLDIDDPVVIAQELDINFSASVEGVVIPAEWVQAAIDSHIKLNIVPTGRRHAALDIADEGQDLMAFLGGHGILLEFMRVWSGAGSDIYSSIEKSIDLCEMYEYDFVDYDADGLGAAARGDSRIINKKRIDDGKEEIIFNAFQGSSKVINPTHEVFKVDVGDSKKGRTNEDYFVNLKSQSWWALRKRFLNTYRAVKLGAEFDKDEIISISSKIDNLSKLVSELSQPTFSQNNVGKMLIDKKPKGQKSPNMADSVMIYFAPKKIRRSFYDISKPF